MARPATVSASTRFAVAARRAEDDLAREVASHLALLEEQFRNEGMTPMRRALAARRAFGGVEQAKEHQRDARAFRWIADLRQDMTYGARSFARSPGFTAAAIVTLALGIGAATTIFGALYAIGLRPLSYADPDRIVRVFEYLPPREAGGAPRRGHPFAPSQLETVRRASTLSHVGLEIPRLMVMRAGRHAVARRRQPRLGRDLPADRRAADPRPRTSGRGRAEGLRQRRRHQPFALAATLAGRDDVIGAHADARRRPHTIVGVMPAGFQFPPGSSGEIWTPLVPAGTPPTFRLPFYARLRDGVLAGRGARGDRLDLRRRSLDQPVESPPARSGAGKGRADRTVQAGDHGAGGGGDPGLADRLRQRREPGAGALDRPADTRCHCARPSARAARACFASTSPKASCSPCCPVRAACSSR